VQKEILRFIYHYYWHFLDY